MRKRKEKGNFNSLLRRKKRSVPTFFRFLTKKLAKGQLVDGLATVRGLVLQPLKPGMVSL